MYKSIDHLTYQHETGNLTKAEYKRELEAKKGIRVALGDTQAVRFINELLRALEA